MPVKRFKIVLLIRFYVFREKNNKISSCNEQHLSKVLCKRELFAINVLFESWTGQKDIENYRNDSLS